MGYLLSLEHPTLKLDKTSNYLIELSKLTLNWNQAIIYLNICNIYTITEVLVNVLFLHTMFRNI